MATTSNAARANPDGSLESAPVRLATILPPANQPSLPILPESATIAEVRQQMIAEAAYFLAAQRGFAPGHEINDWLAAESAIDRGPLKGASPALIDRRRR